MSINYATVNKIKMEGKKMVSNKKRRFTWHGRNYYYIGQDNNGMCYYYQESEFDCSWYWGIGYIESFTNNRNPERSKDISCHTHFDYLMKEQGKKNLYHDDAFKEVFPINPFNNKEIWTILEIMNSLYTARRYSDMIHTKGSHITGNPCKDIIASETEYKRINEIVIPALLNELYKIMTGETEGN